MSEVYKFTAEEIEKLEADSRKLLSLQSKPVEAVKLMSLQPGTTKLKDGKTYTLNDNHRWTVEEDSPGQQRLFHGDNIPEENPLTIFAEEKTTIPQSHEAIDQAKKDYQENGVRAEAFKNWFGDWENGEGSKVVDDQGTPKEQVDLPRTVYHGTGDVNFKEFKSSKTGTATTRTDSSLKSGESLLYGPGFYFTDEAEIAQSYADQAPQSWDYSLSIDKEKAADFVLREAKIALENKHDKPQHIGTDEEFSRREQLVEFIDFLERGGDIQQFMNDPSLAATPEGRGSRADQAFMVFMDMKIQHVLSLISKRELATEGGVKEVYLNIRNPFRINEMPVPVKGINRKDHPRLARVLVAMRDDPAKYPDENAFTYRDFAFAAQNAASARYNEEFEGGIPVKQELNLYLQSLGYDGLQHFDSYRSSRKETNVWIAFEPEQIKDVNNRGTFDASDPKMKMSLQPGSRKTENGKEYVLNQNSRWERADKGQGQKRATTRDQAGVNGELYQPGQFISTVDKPKKKRDARIAAARDRKQETAPYTWEKPPSGYHTSIFSHHVGTALQFGAVSGGARSGDRLSIYEPFKAQHPELDWDEIGALADKYNQGDRWFQTEQNLADQAQDEAAIDSARKYEVDVLESSSGETTFRPTFEPRDFIPYKPQPGTKNSDYIGAPGTPSDGLVPDMEFIKSRGGKLTAPTKAGPDYLSAEAARSGAIAYADHPVGRRVNARIDIPTFEDTGKYIGTLHIPGTRVADVIGYTPAVRMKDVSLMNNELTAVQIMEGVSKTTVAAAEGEVVPFEMPSDEELDRDWSPIGYNPQHAVFYYDKQTGREVRKGAESISIGNTIFIKTPEYGDRNTTDNPYDVRYASIRGDQKKPATVEKIQGFLNRLNQDKLKRVVKRESEDEHNLRMALQPGITKTALGKTYTLNDNHRWELNQKGLFGEIERAPEKAKKENAALADPTIQPVPQVPTDARESGPGWASYGPKKELSQWYLRQKLDSLNQLAADGKLERIEGGRDPRILVNLRMKYGRPADMSRKMLSPVYLSGSWSPSVSEVAKAQGQQIGMLITPDTKSNAKHLNIDMDDGSPEYIAVDNGVFGGNFDSRKFLSLLDDLAEKQVQNITLFVTAPDSFDRASMTGDAKETIKNFRAWSQQIRMRGFPAAMVAQDGLEDEIENIPWEDMDVLFIGGSDEFKLGKFTGRQKEKWEKIWSEARRRGVPVHVGRVNSLSRLKFAESREFDSADGNFIKHGPDINAPKVGKWLKKLEQKEQMDRSSRNRNQGKILDAEGQAIAMALQPGQTKSLDGKTYVLNQNHRWTLRSQGGLFGDDFKPGKWTPEEHEKLTGEKKEKEKAPQERQSEMFDRGKKSDLPGQNLLFEDEDGVDRKPSESERSLASSEGDTPYHKKARTVVARHYLATSATFFDFQSQQMKPLDAPRVTGMMDGVDLSKPVVVGPPPSVPPPEQFAQWQAPGGNRGGYFSTIDAEPGDLGIGDLATAWGLPDKPILKRERKLYSLEQTPNAHYMRSTAKETVDTWGAPGVNQKAMGGGMQWFIPTAADPTVRIQER